MTFIHDLTIQNYICICICVWVSGCVWVGGCNAIINFAIDKFSKVLFLIVVGTC